MRNSSIALCAASLLAAFPLLAETPLGWISGDMVSAYTQNARAVEVTGQSLLVNDTVDVFSIREDLLIETRRLVDNSGDLSGWQGGVEVGVLDSLSLFYRRQSHDLVLKLGPINSIDVLDIDEELATTSEEVGLKWMLYRADLLTNFDAFTAGTLELSWLENESENFGLDFDAIRIASGNLTASIRFPESQNAGLENLRDQGWRARFIYSTSPSSDLVSSFWFGYSRHSTYAGTDTTIPLASLRDALRQSIRIREQHLRAGFSVNWQLRPRLPLQLGWEYLHIRDQEITVSQEAAPSGLPIPAFLSSTNLSQERSNHVFSGTISYWITPQLHIGLTGKLFANQLLGVIPHYNNPLSASFSNAPFGYLGLRIGLDLFKARER